MRRAAVAAVAALLAAGCAFRYGGYSGTLGCVNVTGPGFSLQCPEVLQAPALPDGQYAPPPSP